MPSNVVIVNGQEFIVSDSQMGVIWTWLHLPSLIEKAAKVVEVVNNDDEQPTVIRRAAADLEDVIDRISQQP